MRDEQQQARAGALLLQQRRELPQRGRHRLRAARQRFGLRLQGTQPFPLA